jgi:serine/threonine protein kinase
MNKSQHKLVELLLLDQHDRWARGQSTLVESYLKRHPALEAHEDGILDLIYNEIFLRERRGDAPQLEEYLRRFPRLAQQLQMQFAVHEAIKPSDVLPALDDRDHSIPHQNAALAIPGYEILGELGRGSMGVVYKARQISLQRLVALKVLPAGNHTERQTVARFRAEAAAVAQLQHPHIVQVYEVGEVEGRPFFSLELVEGGNLAQYLAGTPQPEPLAAQLVETLARAMHTAHQRGIIHRDLKPANILLSAERGARGAELFALAVPKITDFGLAKRLQCDLSQTQAGTILGTAGYMAPEQARGQARQVGPATDVYGLGAILYEMLTGRRPFQAETVVATLLQGATQEPKPPSHWQSKVARDLEAICVQCLRRHPRDRYPTAEALADDLRRFLDGKPVQARPPGLGERMLKWVRRQPTVAALMGVSGAAILALGIGGWMYAGQRHQERERDEQHAAQLQKERDAFQTAQLHQERQLQEQRRAAAEQDAIRRATFIGTVQEIQTGTVIVDLHDPLRDARTGTLKPFQVGPETKWRLLSRPRLQDGQTTSMAALRIGDYVVIDAAGTNYAAAQKVVIHRPAPKAKKKTAKAT